MTKAKAKRRVCGAFLADLRWGYGECTLPTGHDGPHTTAPQNQCPGSETLESMLSCIEPHLSPREPTRPRAHGEGRGRGMNTEQRIAANYYERGWTVVTDPENYDAAELAMLVAAGKLKWRGDVRCIEGHTVYGDASTPAEAKANTGIECHRCTPDELSTDPDDYTIAVRYVVSEAWRTELDAANPWVECEHCGGEGKVRRARPSSEG